MLAVHNLIAQNVLSNIQVTEFPAGVETVLTNPKKKRKYDHLQDTVCYKSRQ